MNYKKKNIYLYIFVLKTDNNFRKNNPSFAVQTFFSIGLHDFHLNIIALSFFFLFCPSHK